MKLTSPSSIKVLMNSFFIRIQNELVSLETKLSGLENDLVTNQKTIEKIRDTVKELRKQQVVIKEESKSIRSKGKSPVNKTFAAIAKVDLQFPSVKPSQCDIRMDDVYDKIKFQNRYSDIRERVGRDGKPFLIITRETTYWNQGDEVLCITRASTIRR